ncbi:MAG: hypothetical protein J7M27_08595, partial [Candidatus Latescibacteria bacterium]|nr:hypothetical protein [Candidatus Latescibacterota bacterium]
FIYSPRNPLWNYDQAMYDFGMYCQYADCVRVLRRAGRSKDYVERFMKHWGNALFTRIVLTDGANNMVFNTYGWERSVVGCAYGEALWLHPVIAVADLTPYDAGELKAMFDQGAERLRKWDFQYPFPPDLGIRGWSSAQEEDRMSFPYELGLMFLDDPEAIEEAPTPYIGCLSSLAWKEGNFVMQTPAYHATVVGTSPGYGGIPASDGETVMKTSPGADNVHGIPTSGGEYVIRIPDGDYLFPLSDKGRASFGAVVEGRAIHSAQLTKTNAEEWHFSMGVRLPDGTVLAKGKPYGPLLYDPKTEGITLEVAFGDDSVRLEREMTFALDRISVTDRLTALRDVTVEKAYSRIPIITVSPHNELAEITGTSGGNNIRIRPPFFMGPEDADYLHHDQEYIQSLRSLELLRVAYPDYGFEVRQRSEEEIRLAITPWEWQENRRMRVDGKNLDYVWIYEPTNMTEGEWRELRYEIVPFGKERNING